MSDPIEQPVEGLLEPKPRKGRGCFFWGCLGAGIIGGLLILLVGGGIAFLLREVAVKFTSTQPVPVPVHDLKPGEYEDIQKRVEAFKTAARANKSAELVLSADDINALIAGDDELKKFGGEVFFRIEDDQVLLDVSYPLDHLWFMGGRFFNGTFGVMPVLARGRLLMFLESATVNGEPVPEEYLGEFKRKNLLENQRGEKEWDFVENAKSLKVEGGKITLTR